MDLSSLASYLGISVFSFYLIFILLMVWCLIWKGIALWKSAKHDDLTWFVVLLIINTMGILEILYIFVFAKREYKENESNMASSESRIVKKNTNL